MGEDWGALVEAEARAQGVDPNLARSVMRVESAGDTKATSKKGAIGLMQLMPDTAAEMGVDPYDPHQNIRGGVGYLRKKLKEVGGDPRKALAAYNAGLGRVANPPKETQQYVRDVMGDDLDVVTPKDWQRQDASGMDVVTPRGWMPTPPPDMPKKPTKPGEPVNLPTVESQAEALKRGAPGQFLRPSNVMPVIGTLVGGATGIPALATAGAMGGSILGQKMEGQDIDPVRTGLDVGFGAMGELGEGYAANRLAQSGVKTMGREAEEAGARLSQPRLSGTFADQGSGMQADILAKQAADRTAAGQGMEAAFKPYAGMYVPDPADPTKAVTLQQLHEAQIEMGRQRAAAWRVKDYPAWRAAKEQQEKTLDIIQSGIEAKGGKAASQAFMGARQNYAKMAQAAENPVVNDLMDEAHDNISRYLLNPKAVEKNRGATFGGGTYSPQDLVATIKGATDPAQFQHFKDGVYDRIIQASTRDGALDAAAMRSNIQKMGGQYSALFDPGEIQDINRTLAIMERKIPEVPSASQALVQQGPGVYKAATAAVGAQLAVSHYGAGSVGQTMAVGTVLAAWRMAPVIKVLLKSPGIRRAVQEAAGAPLASPVWDAIGQALIQATGIPAKTALDIPPPPRPIQVQGNGRP